MPPLSGKLYFTYITGPNASKILFGSGIKVLRWFSLLKSPLWLPQDRGFVLGLPRYQMLIRNWWSEFSRLRFCSVAKLNGDHDGLDRIHPLPI